MEKESENQGKYIENKQTKHSNQLRTFEPSTAVWKRCRQALILFPGLHLLPELLSVYHISRFLNLKWLEYLLICSILITMMQRRETVHISDPRHRCPLGIMSWTLWIFYTPYHKGYSPWALCILWCFLCRNDKSHCKLDATNVLSPALQMCGLEVAQSKSLTWQAHITAGAQHGL